MEVFRDIENYEGLYQVSSEGRVYSVPRVSPQGHMVGGVFLVAAQKKSTGYFRVGLHKEGKSKLEQLSKLVAKAFPEICGEWFDGCEVHHKNYNPLDNRAENLIVLTSEEHKKYHSDSDITYNRRSESQKEVWKTRTKRVCNAKAVIQCDLLGNYIETYPSLKEAGEQTGTNIPALSSCLNGKYKTAGGYTWKYLETGMIYQKNRIEKR